MRLRDDERAQSIQIGAVLLFAVLIVAFTSYQAFVVPQQNEQVEFDHNQRVQQDLHELRNAIAAARNGGTSRATTVSLGPRYPARALAANPEPPAGSLRTVGTSDAAVNVTIRNATADGEAGDVWDGSPRAFDTGILAYAPGYNRYRTAPVTTYEQTLLYDDFGHDAVVLANQSMVDGREIDLVALNGSLSRTRTGATTVDVRPISADEEAVLVDAAASDAPVTITFQSRLSPDRWRSILGGETHVAAVSRSAGNGTATLHGVRVELATGVAYRLRLAKVGVGRGATAEPPAYLDVGDGAAASVVRGTDREISFVVRDRYDNPVSNVSVNVSVDGTGAGSLSDSRVFTDAEGRATVTYRTGASTATGTHRVRATTGPASRLGGTFDADGPTDAGVAVTVSSGGPYDLVWQNPATTAGNDGSALSNCSPTACTWDVSQDSDDRLALQATTDPSVDGLGVDFAVADADVADAASESATTGASGSATVDLVAGSDGTTMVYALGGGAGGAINVTVRNAP